MNSRILRSTEQRRVLRTILEGSDRPLSVNEILSEAQKELRKLGLATVYRNLRTFIEEGWLISVDLPGEATRYETAGRKHHHHFHCQKCERIFDMPACARGIERGLPRGFVVERHEILLRGLCPECRPPA